MTDIDISALEEALSSKSRKQREGIALRPGLSKRELVDKVRKLLNEIEKVGISRTRIRYQYRNYSYNNGNLYSKNGMIEIDKIPHEALEKLYKRVMTKLQPYYHVSDAIIRQYPEIALEAELEGKTGYEIIEFAHAKRLNQISELLKERISFGPIQQLRFNIRLSCAIRVVVYALDHIESDCNSHPRTIAEAEPLVVFITKFQEVMNQINRQIDNIVIRR